MARSGPRERSVAKTTKSDAPPDLEAHAIKQYGLIVGLKNAVLTGSHPSIKAKLSNVSAQPSVGAENKVIAEQHSRLDANELTRANLSMQRQRAERALREEFEHHRRTGKPAQSQALDLSAVLVQAQKMVSAVNASQEAAVVTNDDEAASDSFDSNTFYSSQHETPQSQTTTRTNRLSEDGRPHQPLASAHDVDSHTHPVAVSNSNENELSSPQAGANPTLIKTTVSSNANALVEANKLVPTHLTSNSTAPAPPGTEQLGQSNHPDICGTVHSLGPQANETSGLSKQQSGAPANMNHAYAPIVIGHGVQPAAPRVSKAASSAVAGYRQDQTGRALDGTSGAKAQAAALRAHVSTLSSPDNSSQGGRLSIHKRGKRQEKKRKADRQALEIDMSPFIKDEPRSPSPLTGTSLRANKRRRQSQRQSVIDLEHHQPRYERPIVHGPSGQYQARQPRPDRVPWDSGALEALPPRTMDMPLYSDAAGHSREYIDSRRLAPENHVSGYAPPNTLPLPYSPGMAYTARPLSQSYTADTYRDPRVRYRGYAEEQSRLSARPLPNSVLTGQPRPGVLVDGFGREYLDPAHTGIQRPTTNITEPGEPHLLYEMLPRRAVSRHSGPLDVYPESDAVYRGTPAPYPMPRRVVTQPSADFASYDYRDIRQRDYWAMAPAGRDFFEVGCARERGFAHEAPVEARPSIRASSMMPLETMGPNFPRGRSEQVQSVRPDVQATGLGAAGAYMSSRGPVQPYLESFPARPVGPYDETYASRGTAEIAFIERPRGATQEIVYADDVRREIYR
ncbi:hypothetical protein CDD82_993 [Ophiocordyceps australis]|uniref:Uncharacterized protein n=1 Tax=Ophiocordyceps australis TaxID=1399860 RepID=A0A2C5ZND4_9HYPO|nr:hypothetical protein CDD82_993 [Ophiocordyceps australis]